MPGTGTSRWTRWREGRRDSTRRLIAYGAVVGLVAGLLAQFAVGGTDPELRGLVRFALVLPAGIFVAWWLMFPGMSLDRDEATAPDVEPVSSEERLREIEATFDERQVPSAPARRPSSGDAASDELLSRSVRRPAPPRDGEDPAAPFRIRRPG